MEMLKNLNFKTIYIGYCVALTALCIFLVPSYGITGDEDIQWKYGDYVWKYIKTSGQDTTLFKDPKLAESPLRMYGGFFDGAAAMMIDVIKPKNEFLLRHYWNSIFGLLSIFFAGLICFELTRRWSIALLGALFLTITPRFFGEMFNNPKDIPFAAGYVISIYYIIRFINYIEKPRWSDVIGLALGIALAIGVRIGGLLVIAYFGFYYILYVILNKKFDFNYLKKSMLYATIAVVGGYVLACLCWPYAMEDMINNPLNALSVMKSYPLSISMLFDGMRVNTGEMPSNYLTKWLWIGTPIYLLLGTAGFVVYLIKNWKSENNLFHRLIIFAFAFPIYYIISGKSVVYDALRHVIFVMPMMAVMTALVVGALLSHFKEKSNNSFYISVALVAILVFLPLKHMVKNHPNQYVYFNEIFGGVKKAFGYYETDYYHNSGKNCTDWIKANVKSDVKVKILSNLGSIPHYFTNDTAKYYANYGRWRERDHLDWDYYVAYSRFIEPENLQNGAWPPANVVYTVKVDDVPVCVVIKRQNKDDMLAYEALQKNDLATAANLYASNLKIDPSNEYSWYMYSVVLANTGRMNEAVEALKNAINLNSSNPEWSQQLNQYYGHGK
jgi:tetratricopeptide (TPR) repeat protein